MSTWPWNRALVDSRLGLVIQVALSFVTVTLGNPFVSTRFLWDATDAGDRQSYVFSDVSAEFFRYK